MKKIVQKIILFLILIIPIGVYGQMSDLIISEYGESARNDYLEIYNGTGESVDLSNYVIWKIINDGEWYERSMQLTGNLKHGQTYTIVSYKADSALLVEGDTIGPSSGVTADFTLIYYNGNESFALAKIFEPGDTSIIDVIGQETTESPDPWDVAGVTGACKEHTIVRKGTVTGPNSNWASSAGTNADDSEWIVYPEGYWDNVGFHSDYNSAPASDLFISEIGDYGNNDYLEIYNGTGNSVDLSNYVIWKIINAGEWYERSWQMGGTLEHGSCFTIMKYSADSALLVKSDTTGPVSGVNADFTLLITNGNESWALAKIFEPGDTSIIDVIGQETTESPDPWDVAGETAAAKDHILIRKSTVDGPNVDWESSAGTNADNSEWIIKDPLYWDDVDKHSMYLGPNANMVDVTFIVDMNEQTVATEGVHVMGSFNGNDPNATAMTDANSDGVYEATVSLEENLTYEYRFVNGNEVGDAETVPAECAQNSNRFVEVGTVDLVLDTVCFGSCDQCVGLYDVTFRVDMSNQTVSEDGVHIIGSFNSFDPAADPMTDSDSDDIYEITKELGGNKTYEYKFVNGNQIANAETVPAECASNNNRTIELGVSDSTTIAYCFNECDVCSTTGIFEDDLNLDISVYPNPANNVATFILNVKENSDLRFMLYTLEGKEIKNQIINNLTNGENRFVINISELPNGTYIYSFSNGKSIYSDELVIIK